MSGICKSKGQRTVNEHCALINKVVWDCGLTVLTPLYAYTRTEQFSKWMADAWS